MKIGDLNKVEVSDIESESVLLGTLLLNNAIIPDVFDELTEDISVFYHRTHQIIYYAIIELFKQSSIQGIDPIIVANFLEKKNTTPEGKVLRDGKTLLDEVGGKEYITEIYEKGTIYINYAEYVRIIKEKYVIRLLLGALSNIYGYITNSDYDVEEILERSEKSIFDIVQKRNSKKAVVRIKDILNKQVDLIEAITNGDHSLKNVVNTGYSALDAQMGGMHGGQLIILAARPAMGKSAFAFNIALNVARMQGKGVMIFSLEMSDEEIGRRFLFMESRINGHNAMQGFLTKDKIPQLVESAALISNYPIFIDDTPGITPLHIKSKLRRVLAQSNNLGLVIVDYLQLMNLSERTESQTVKISTISRYLKEIAKEFDIPVIALSQLSRKTEERTDKRPMLSDLRESGAIEQDADVVLMLYREGYYKKDITSNVTEVIVGKNRNGPVGTVKLAFISSYGRFENLAKREE